jgi:Ca-activated chloride channel family protein
MAVSSPGWRALAAFVLLIVSAVGSAGTAQVFRTRVELVQVAATVTDKSGRLVTGLGRDDFTLFEDGVRQEIAVFSRDRLPVSLGVLVDISDSMLGRRMADARAALDRFVLDLLAREDEAFLLLFNHEPRLLAPWTLPPSSLAHRLDTVRPFGGTAIYDALVFAVPLLHSRQQQRCGFVIISDGADNSSDHKLHDAVRALVPTDAFVYAIAIDEPTGPAIARPFAPYALNDLTGPTGGYTEVIKDSAGLADATERIADELNHQYALAYMPNRQADAQYHTIRVRTRNPAFLVRSRRGYVDTPHRRR